MRRVKASRENAALQAHSITADVRLEGRGDMRKKKNPATGCDGDGAGGFALANGQRDLLSSLNDDGRKPGDEYRLYVDADGFEEEVPDTPMWARASLIVLVVEIGDDYVLEATTVRTVFEEVGPGYRYKIIVPRGQGWIERKSDKDKVTFWRRRRPLMRGASS